MHEGEGEGLDQMRTIVEDGLRYVPLPDMPQEILDDLASRKADFGHQADNHRVSCQGATLQGLEAQGDDLADFISGVHAAIDGFGFRRVNAFWNITCGTQPKWHADDFTKVRRRAATARAPASHLTPALPPLPGRSPPTAA